jgi:hypothetical protein
LCWAVLHSIGILEAKPRRKRKRFVLCRGKRFSFNGAHEIECCAENPSSMARLVDFLLLKIKAANRQGTSSLELVFEDDRKLLLSGDDSPEYESYSIQVFGKNVVVV